MSLGHLYIDDSNAADGERAAKLVLPGAREKLVWFRADQPLCTESGADPFLAATVLTWMEAHCDVHVHGNVSRRLLAGLTEWQAAWARWRPKRYRQVRVTVDDVRDERALTEKTVLAFSGGVDAAYSLRRHATRAAGWQQVDLKAALLVHGFDIPLEQVSVFDRARARAQLMLDGTGVSLLTISTNLRELGLIWEDAFATAVVGSLTLLAPQYGIGLIGSSEPYDRLVLPWGSNPVTDPLLSSGLMEIRHDGAAAGRTEKVRLLAEWPGADYLRVCWQGEELDRNCGRCEKCLRTRLNFALAGVRRPGCFGHEEEPLNAIRLGSTGQRAEWKALLDEARAVGNSAVFKEVETVLRRNYQLDTLQRSGIPRLISRARKLLTLPGIRT